MIQIEKNSDGFALYVKGKYVATFQDEGSAKAGAEVEIRRQNNSNDFHLDLPLTLPSWTAWVPKDFN